MSERGKEEGSKGTGFESFGTRVAWRGGGYSSQKICWNYSRVKIPSLSHFVVGAT